MKTSKFAPSCRWMQCKGISGTASDSKVNVEESVAPPVTPKIVEGSFCADGTRPRSTGGGWPLASRGCFELGSTQMAVVKGRGGGRRRVPNGVWGDSLKRVKCCMKNIPSRIWPRWQLSWRNFLPRHLIRVWNLFRIYSPLWNCTKNRGKV